MMTKLRSETGNNPASVLIILLLVLLCFELVVVGGRLAATQGVVNNAAREAARKGTLVLESGQVQGAVDAVGWENLASGNRPRCSAMAVEAIGVEANFHPGGHVQVDVFCTVDMGDMSPFGMPLPDVEVKGTHTEIIETYRVTERFSG